MPDTGWMVSCIKPPFSRTGHLFKENTVAQFNDYAIPSLSRVDIPMGEIGQHCLHLMVDLIEKKKPNPTVQFVEGKEIIGQSSPR